MLESILKQFPSLLRASVQFYFAPRKFLANLQESIPQTVLTYFAVLSATVIVFNTAHRLIFEKYLFEPQTADLSFKVVYINGEKLDKPEPYIKQIGLLGIHGRFDFRIVSGMEQYVILPVTPSGEVICSIGMFRGSNVDISKGEFPTIDENLLSRTQAAEAVERLLKHSVDIENLPKLDSALRRLMIRICQNNFLYFSGAPGYFVVGLSDDKRHLLESRLWTWPSSEPKIRISPGSIVLSFVLVNTEISGVSPQNIGKDIHIFLYAGFIMAAGFSLVLAFGNRKRGLAHSFRRGFQLSLAILLVPFLIYSAFSAALAIFPYLETLGRCPPEINTIANPPPINSRYGYTCGPSTVRHWAAVAGGLLMVAFCLRYMFVLQQHGFSKLESVKRFAISVVIFLLLSALVLAPLNTLLILNYAILQ